MKKIPKIGDIIKGRKIGYKGTRKFIWTACSVCGREKWVLLISGKPISNRCYSCAKTRKNNPTWKGGERKCNGYILTSVNPKNPFAKMRCYKSYVLEHRLVMAENLGRCLNPEEVVHHINEIRDDNRIENLVLMSNSEHTMLHNILRGGDAQCPQ